MMLADASPDAAAESVDEAGGADVESVDEAGGADAGGLDALVARYEGPRRLVILISNFGRFEPSFAIASDKPKTEDWQIDLTDPSTQWSPILAPLKAHASDLLVLDGLALHTGYLAAAGNAEDAARIMTLTGNQTIQHQEAITGVSASLDVLIAASDPHPAPFPVVRLGDGSSLMSFDSTGAAIDSGSEYDVPQAAWQDIFQGTTCPSSNPNTSGDTFMIQARSLLSDIFRCDRSRVVVLYLDSPALTDPYFTNLDVRRDCSLRATDINESFAQECLTRYDAESAAEVAGVLDTLAALPDGSDRMLDHTVVAWINGRNLPGHHLKPVDWVLAGGRRLGMPTGHYRHLAQTPSPYPEEDVCGGSTALPDYCSPFIGPAHNHALVSVARMLGDNVDAVGLRSLHLPDGTDLDLTGGLPGL